MWQAVLDGVPSPVAVLDSAGTVLATNRAWRGQHPSAQTGANFLDDCEDAALVSAIRSALSGEADEQHVEHVTPQGDRLAVAIRVAPADDGGRCVVLTGEDSDQTARLRERLKHQSLHDPLTGLPNRALLVDRLSHAVAASRRSGQPPSLLLIDLDRFKYINDTLGHSFGDLLLEQVARRVERCVRPGDTVARMGGDQFAVLLPDTSAAAGAVAVSERVLKVLTSPFSVLDHTQHYLSASIGIAVGAAGLPEPEVLLTRADIALHHAKLRARGTWLCFEPAMDAAFSDRVALENDLRHALARDQLEVHYQPIVDLSMGTVVSVEALARWRHPERGLISPTVFIPIAEETGLILDIGQWILEGACTTVRDWQKRWPEHAELALNVNLSALQFHQADLPQRVAAALQATGLEPSHLNLEITESVAMNDTETTTGTITDLKALGVRLGIDDFGTGFSSLSFLQRIPFDVIKVDRSFVSAIDEGNGSRSITEAVVALGKALERVVVAEGIEDIEHLRFLNGIGCQFGQGYLFSRPLDARQMGDLLEAWAHTVRAPRPAASS